MDDAEAFDQLVEIACVYVERQYMLSLPAYELQPLRAAIEARLHAEEKPMTSDEVARCCDVILEDLPKCVLETLQLVGPVKAGATRPRYSWSKVEKT